MPHKEVFFQALTELLFLKPFLDKSEKWFWIKAVLLGKFEHAPGIRLMGTVGEKRQATIQELDTFKKPLRKLKLFKGYKPLWGVMKYGRDIFFESFEIVKCGPMEFVETI